MDTPVRVGKALIMTLLTASSIHNASAQAVIDVHSHSIPQSYRTILSQHNALLEEGFPLPQWDVKAQLAWMDEAGVKTSVLTLAAPQPYFGDIQESRQAVRQLNEEAARIKKEYPGRFRWCATLPLPDVRAAIEEAKYALDTLHADGIKLATNVRGQYLGAPELDSLMAFLSSRHTTVILHPHKPDPVNSQVMEQTPLAMQEYLSETTRAVANMISRNVLARYPDMKLVVPHCGAYLPIAIPRMKSLTPVMQQTRLIGEIDWERNLTSLYYDLAGSHSPEAIRLLLTITSPSHLLYGSDYPYVAPQVLTASLKRMEGYLSAEPDLQPYREMILWKNAQTLFGE
ncbi:MAG: amidohydrolase [Prevotella sp.]|nr:amidohydrolase [Prevotella sp.]